MSPDPDHEFEHVENELRRFKPAEPSPRLKRRLESSVSFPPMAAAVLPEPRQVGNLNNLVTPPSSVWGSRPWMQRAAAAMIGAAIVLALFSFGSSGNKPNEGDEKQGPIVKAPKEKVAPLPEEAQPIDPTFPRDAIRPDSFRFASHENQYYDSHDDGIIYSHDNVPYRRVRYDTVDRRVYRDPKTGATFEMRVPREDVLLVPAETF